MDKDFNNEKCENTCSCGHDHSNEDSLDEKENLNSQENQDSKKSFEENLKSEKNIIEELNNQIDSFKNKLLLALAENENLRKRFEKEKQDLIKYSVSKFASEILNVVDNVERAINTIPDDEIFKKLKDGMNITEKELIAILDRNKVVKIQLNVGDEFNPHLHQAMMEEKNDNLKNGTIAKVLQNGYMLHERVLRPSLVSVVKN